jgi:hypothetical protein
MRSVAFAKRSFRCVHLQLASSKPSFVAGGFGSTWAIRITHATNAIALLVTQ